jgi:ubiquinone/menaquinone biosynthesis C-methylase UbiE
VSCGTGILAEAILNKYGPFRRLVVNDPSPKMLEQTKYKLRYEEAEFTSHFSEQLPYPDHSFSQIICLNSFHYYTDQKTVLKHFRRLLKPGGTLWLQDWNRTGWFVIVNQFINLMSPENINTRSSKEISSLAEECGFTIQEKDQWSFRWWKFYFMRCE